MAEHSRTLQLLDIALGGTGSTREFVEARRAQGHSWPQIARALDQRIGGLEPPVSDEQIRVWFAKPEAKAS